MYPFLSSELWALAKQITQYPSSHGEMIYLKYLRRAHFVQTESSAWKKIDPSFLTELLNGVTNGSTRHIELNGYFVQRICLVIFDFAFVYHFYEA